MFKDNWIDPLAELKQRGEVCIMITVLEHHGSTPRDSGTKMLITPDQQYATIGGGHLEHLATKMAREMLAEGKDALAVERFDLGARLGQCCGGSATLMFEPIGQSLHHLVVFGAGHVAKALLHVVATLPFRVTWIDQREEQFPAQLPDNVTKLVSDDPAGDVLDMAKDSYYLVMTHNHQLDFDLAKAILKRGDAKYFGMIGSQTKKKRFQYRLRARDFTDTQINQMICPIGISAVVGKHPAEIAISVAGELIATYQGRALENKQKPNLVQINSEIAKLA
ncbi:xanthine dehydrogenase accessory protein XdhC [Moritella sp. 36]|uniref:xanthine dehydrogenase accessory protein XdhC n=1 Tax=Moritella sp. 36 TaxID=2746233 RepID=UPI001BACFF39|nr:xanthine dehydrogenase accessory protein XdhC [Moritella sp. 36]QUM90165.1 xanthine dehydrogenase accessory protein XdhC [Moritella sp. 36]